MTLKIINLFAYLLLLSGLISMIASMLIYPFHLWFQAYDAGLSKSFVIIGLPIMFSVGLVMFLVGGGLFKASKKRQNQPVLHKSDEPAED